MVLTILPARCREASSIRGSPVPTTPMVMVFGLDSPSASFLAVVMAFSHQISGRQPGHHQFFISGHDPDLHAARRAVDGNFAARLLVGHRIEHDSQFAQVVANGSPQVMAILADSAGKDNGVRPAQFHEVRAQVVSHAGGVNVQGQPGPDVALAGGLGDVAIVAAHAADAQQTALVGQDRKHFRQRLACLAHDQRQGEGIEIAHAVVLRQAALGTHAHRRGHALALANGAQGTGTAQMAGDDPQVAATKQLGRPLGNVAMAGPVEPPTADVEGFRHL